MIIYVGVIVNEKIILAFHRIFALALNLSCPSVCGNLPTPPITISSEDVITHSTPIPAPTITLRKSAHKLLHWSFMTMGG